MIYMYRKKILHFLCKFDSYRKDIFLSKKKKLKNLLLIGFFMSTNQMPQIYV